MANHVDIGNSEKPFDSGLRVLNFYDINTDCCVSRIDFKIRDIQYGVGFYSGEPIKPQLIVENNKSNEMITPKNGIFGCINVKGNSEEILRALEELVTNIKKALS